MVKRTLRYWLPVVQVGLLEAAFHTGPRISFGEELVRVSCALAVNVPAVFCRMIVWPILHRLFWRDGGGTVDALGYNAFLPICAFGLWYWVGCQLTAQVPLTRRLASRPKLQWIASEILLGLVGLVFLAVSPGRWLLVFGSGHTRLDASLAAVPIFLWGLSLIVVAALSGVERKRMECAK